MATPLRERIGDKFSRRKDSSSSTSVWFLVYPFSRFRVFCVYMEGNLPRARLLELDTACLVWGVLAKSIHSWYVVWKQTTTHLPRMASLSALNFRSLRCWCTHRLFHAWHFPSAASLLQTTLYNGLESDKVHCYIQCIAISRDALWAIYTIREKPLVISTEFSYWGFLYPELTVHTYTPYCSLDYLHIFVNTA